jgi:hypothetical protein
MPDNSNKLWPFSRGLAIAAIPIILLLSVLIIIGIYEFFGWPEQEIHRWVILLVAVISFIPLILVLLDFFASSRAVLEVRGVKIDFSKIDIDNPKFKRYPIGIPDNIGVKGPIISDTAPMDILSALNETIQSELAVINLGRGDSWWVTRLLTLAAGATRVDGPEAFVFIGDRENTPNHFLGWAKPGDVLEAILRDKEQYKIRYQKSLRIAKQFELFKDPDLLPNGLILPGEVTRYSNDTRYSQSGENVAEQILMDQLALTYGYDNTGSLEDPPDRLTLGRLMELFGHCLYRQSIDLANHSEAQIRSLIDSKAPFLALVNQGVFDSMLKREDGEWLILKALLEQSK